MRNRVAAIAMSVVFGTVCSSWADPIQITGGVVTGSVSSVTDYRITGPDFAVAGILGAAVSDEPHYLCGFDSCAPGSSLDLSTLYDRIEDIELNGSVYHGVTGFINFQSETIVLPDVPFGERVPFVRPFTFVGRLENVGSMGPIDLVGSGEVRLSVVNFEQGAGVGINRTDFVFSDPVPEPATLLLAGAGLAAVVSRRVRRRPSA